MPTDAAFAPPAQDDLPPHAPSREAGLAQLAAFVPISGRDYATRRNSDLPGHPHVSRLSPWLRHRAVTEAEVAAAVLDRYGASTAEKFLTEVLWRTYFKGWLERRPGTWDAYRQGLKRARDRIATEAGMRRAWEAACDGRTGIEPFDHWARELRETGYLHNHARMWFASIWMHTLRLPWELGADFFLRHLLDGDPASNTLSWRWVGGLHTRNKIYQARASNIAKFSDHGWDARTLGHQLAPEGSVIDLDAPAHPDPIAPPEDAEWDRSLRTGLLFHEDDLHPDFLRTRGLEPVAAAVLIAPAARSPLAVSDRVVSFTTALAEDAALLQRKTCPTQAPTTDPEAIVAWAEAEGLRQIVTPYVPVGPMREAVDALEARLPIPLIRPLRAWDAATWPYATAGFFKAKARLRDVLETIPQDLG
jgi:deoxyribodipyrimidine photo-lyase